MKQSLIFLYAVICAGSMVALTGCETGERPSIPEDSTAQDVQTPAPVKNRWAKSIDLETQIEFSREDLSKRLAIEPDTISVSSADLVNWRSGALGCPEPGMNYTQALVPGVLIVLKVGKEAHEYHANLGGTPFYCPQEHAEKPANLQSPDQT